MTGGVFVCWVASHVVVVVVVGRGGGRGGTVGVLDFAFRGLAVGIQTVSR